MTATTAASEAVPFPASIDRKVSLLIPARSATTAPGSPRIDRQLLMDSPNLTNVRSTAGVFRAMCKVYGEYNLHC